MLTLAINTATRRIAVALLENGRVKKECEWRSKNDESRKLLSQIQRLLKASGKCFRDIGAILAVSGPGPFSSLRIGVTAANTLALALNVPLYEIDIPNLWRLPENLSIFQELNEQELRDLQAIRLKPALEKSAKMLRFGRALEKLPRRLWKKRRIITPLYFRPPNITKKSLNVFPQSSPSASAA